MKADFAAYKRVLHSWDRYKQIELLSNLTLKADEVNDFQFLNIKNMIQKDGHDKIKISLSERLFEFMCETLWGSDKQKTYDIFLALPLVEKIFNREMQYLPLFIVKIHETYENLFSLPLNSVPTNGNNNVIYPSIEFDFYSFISQTDPILGD